MKNLKMFYCKKLNCKMTCQGCLNMQKRASAQKLFEKGIITRSNIAYLIDPLANLPCPCSNPIARA